MKRLRENPARRGSTGFTLIEIAVVIVIMVLLTSMAIPTIGNITRVDLRTTASRTAVHSRATCGCAFERRKLTRSTASSAVGANHRGCSRPQ